MKTIVVGGHSRNIGKTSVVEGIIRSLPEYGWTAVKVTQFGHGICAVNGNACRCATDEHATALLVERSRDGRSDTSRFLRAGAHKTFWVRTKQGMLHLAMPELMQTINDDAYVIFESNSILEFLQPDLYLMVMDYTVQDFKNSAQRFFNWADAYLLIDPAPSSPPWKDPSIRIAAERPVFTLSRPQYSSPEEIAFIRRQLI